MRTLSALAYFIIIKALIIIAIIVLIVEAPNIPEPKSFYDALNEICNIKDFPLNDDYYSFWSAILMIFFLNQLVL